MRDRIEMKIDYKIFGVGMIHNLYDEGKLVIQSPWPYMTNSNHPF